MRALVVRQLRRLGLYKPARAARDWYLRGAQALSAALHRRKMRKFYSQFIAKGDLCFDVGANVGNRTEIFLQLGAKVVCIEPQRSCAEQLKKLFGRRPNVTIVEKALGAREGYAELAVCDEDSALSTLSDGWITDSRFAQDCHWTGRQRVALTTLDALIALYGIPRFCKIDVEGFECEVLRGLTRPIPFLSFEFNKEFLSHAQRCVEQLLSTGRHDFQISLGESMDFVFRHWVEPRSLLDALGGLPADALWGDIYARHI